MEYRVVYGHYLTNKFVPEVLSPLMVRIATIIEYGQHTDWWQNIAIIIPILAEQLEARNHMAMATTMLSPC